jgi:hypothetical protein
MRQRLRINIKEQGCMVFATFEEKRDFSVAVCVLKQVGFAVNEESLPSPVMDTPLSQGTSPFDFVEGSGPRLSSITPAPRLISQPFTNESYRGPSSASVGDLCFIQPGTSDSHDVLGHNLSSQGWSMAGGPETTLSPNHHSMPLTAQSPHLNPYNYFASKQHFEKYIPKTSSPLRNTLFRRASTPELIDPQLHPILGRRASFTESTHPEGLWNNLKEQEAVSHSQPSAQVNHYMTCETSPESSQSSPNAQQIEQDEPMEKADFRILMPQPRNLPFRPQLSPPEGESSPSKSPVKRMATPARPRSSPKDSSNQAKKTSRDLKKASSESMPPGSKLSPRFHKGNFSKRPLDDSPSPTGKDDTSLSDTPPQKKAKSGKVKDTRIGRLKSHPRPQSKLSESSPKPASKPKELNAVKGLEKDETQERSVKDKSPSSVTNDDVQQKLPKNRPVTRKCLRDAGGSIEQLTQDDGKSASRIEGRPQDTQSALVTSDKSLDVTPGNTQGSVQDTVRSVSLAARKGKARRTSKPAVQEKPPYISPCDRKKRSRASTASMHRPNARKGTRDDTKHRRHDQKRAPDSSAMAPVITALTTDKAVSSDNTVSFSTLLQSSEGSEVTILGDDTVGPQVVLVTDEMLRRVNEATSAVLDQYVTDLGRGYDERVLAELYMERVEAVRKDTWYMHLAGGRGLA